MPTKITASTFNSTFATVLSQYLGTTGSGQIGYGQAINVTSKSAGQKITTTDWANLRADILRMSTHQGISQNASWTSGTLTSIPTLPTITAGIKINQTAYDTFVNALGVVTNTTASGPYYKLDSTLSNGQYSDETLTSSSRPSTSTWNQTIRHFFTIDFGSVNNARYFFNSGGTIRIDPGFSTTSSASIDTNWNTLINTNSGITSFGRITTVNTVGGTTNFGYYNITTDPTYTTVFTRTGTTPYAVNDYTIDAAKDATGRYLYFRCYFRDDKGPNPNTDESVTGTVTNTVTMYRPTGSNVVVTAPTAANTILLTAAQGNF